MSSDLPELRASHEDRDRVVETLRVAGGDGRLTAEELDTRLESALSARTLGELAELTSDLPTQPSTGPAPKDVLKIEQQGSKYARTGRWVVPGRIDLRTKLCQVTLDFTDAVITAGTLRIDMDMQHGKLHIVTAPDIEIDADALVLTYSKLKLRSGSAGGGAGVGAVAGVNPRLRIELAGSLKFGKVIEQR